MEVSDLFYLACKNGDLDTVKKLVASNKIDAAHISVGLSSSAIHDKLEVLKFLIEKCNVVVTSIIVECVCKFKSRNVVEYLIDVKKPNISLNSWLYEAVNFYNLNLAFYLIDKGANCLTTCVFSEFSYKIRRELIVKVLQHDKIVANSTVISVLCKYENELSLIKRTVELLEEKPTHIWFKAACSNLYDNCDIVKYIMSLASSNINYGLVYANKADNISIIKYLIESGATQFSYISDKKIQALLNLGIDSNLLDGRIYKYIKNRDERNKVIREILLNYTDLSGDAISCVCLFTEF